MALKKSQKSLKNWTKQKWRYSSKSESKKPRAKRGRYLPDAAWKALSDKEKEPYVTKANQLKEEGIKLGYVTAKEFDTWVRPEDMCGEL